MFLAYCEELNQPYHHEKTIYPFNPGADGTDSMWKQIDR